MLYLGTSPLGYILILTISKSGKWRELEVKHEVVAHRPVVARGLAVTRRLPLRHRDQQR